MAKLAIGPIFRVEVEDFDPREILMLLDNMNWMDVEEYLEDEDRLVLVTGSTEEHGYYSVATDTSTTWEIAKAACEEAGVALAPALPYGPSPGLMGYPGTVSIGNCTYLNFVRDILESFIRHGFKRIFILNGHGGNKVAQRILCQVREDHPDVMVKFKSWYNLPSAKEMQEELGGKESHHGAWIEGFSWINKVGPIPVEEKEEVDWSNFRSLTGAEVRERLGDGSGGGTYYVDEETERKYFQVAVNDVVDVLNGDWTP